MYKFEEILFSNCPHRNNSFQLLWHQTFTFIMAYFENHRKSCLIYVLGNPLINHAGSMLNPMAHAPHHHSMGPDLTPTPAGVGAGADDWYSKSLSAFKMSHVAAAAASTTSPQGHAHLQHPGLMPY